MVSSPVESVAPSADLESESRGEQLSRQRQIKHIVGMERARGSYKDVLDKS